MKPKPKSADSTEEGRKLPLAVACFGAFLGLALLKFGNPPIMEKWVQAPKDLLEFVLDNPWPISWAYALLALVAIFAFSTAGRRLEVSTWLVTLPAWWLVWQFIASAATINHDLTRPVLAHFTACVVCFYLGLFCSGHSRSLAWLMPGLVCAFLIVIAIGWQQHFGGLEQTRRYFFMYLYPKMKEVPPEYIKKLSSTRIFSTLFYPNALAGAILLLLPATLQFVWQARERFTIGARIFLVAGIGLGALGCLYWSGSKGGWLLLLLLALLWLLRLPFSLKRKRLLVGALLMLGLVGFFWKYSGFFQKGATSVGARFDYWDAAVKSTLMHPIVGTGPGTFSVTYQRLKRPESEMARLAHNDYLQQASDSGLPGFLLYSGFIVMVLVLTFPPNQRMDSGESLPVKPEKGGKSAKADNPLVHYSTKETSLWFAVWLGTLGWALQSLVEFGLYIPALAWTAFAFLGFLLSRQVRSRSRKSIDNQSGSR